MAETGQLLQSSPWGYAHHKILLNALGKPVDYEFIDANRAFAKLMGWEEKDFLGRRASELFPEKGVPGFDWIGFYGAVALSGESALRKYFSEVLGKWYRLQAFPSQEGCVTALFVEIALEKEISSISGFPRETFGSERTGECCGPEERGFRAFFETMDDMIFIADREGKIFYVNPEMTKKLGYTLEELRNMYLLDLRPRNRREEAKEYLQEMFAGRRNTCPLPLETKEGALLPAETRVWLGEWDGTEALFGICKDLSREQEALQKFNKVFQSNPAPMALSDMKDRLFTEVNQAFLDYLEYTEEEVLGKTGERLNIFGDIQQLKALRAEVYRKGSVRRWELEFRTKSGAFREGLFSGEVVESQGKPYLLSVIVDMTDRKRAERELASQAKMQEMLMHTAKRYINMSLEEMDSTVEDSLGEISRFVKAHRAYVFDYHWDRQTCSNTYEWCDAGIVSQKEILQELPLEGIPWWTETHRRGKALYIPDVSALPEEDEVREILEPQGVQSLMTVPMMHSGECVGFVGFDSVLHRHAYSAREKSLLEVFAEIMVNVKIRKALENRLIEEKENAQAASRAKSEFLANMSHEIRTPLNGVIGFTDLLRHTPLSSVQEEYLRNAHASGHALLEIIDDILDFSKIEAGKLDLEIVKTDLLDLAEESVSIVRYGADQKGLKVFLDLDPAMPRYAFVDPVRLRQVLANLLSNAVKFTEKGKVTLAIRFAPQNVGRGKISFSVRDTGIGIDQEEQAKLFRAFSQGDSSTTRKFGGTGLGLVISEKLVRKMGGSIELYSLPGRGSTFFFSIDVFCENEMDSSKKVEEKVSFDKSASVTILIAEDHSMNMLLLKKYLRSFVPLASLLEAKNGVEAVREAFDKEPTLLFMDVQMPEMDGNEATRIIRNREKGTKKHLPIIGLTAGALDTERETSLQAGMDDFLTKPLAPERLERILGKYLAVKKRAGENAPLERLEEEVLHFDAALLLKDVGDSDFFEDLLETALDSFPKNLASLKEALAEEDYSGAIQVVRLLKGSASNMRFYYVENLTKNMEEAILQGYSRKIQHLQESLEEEWEILVHLLLRRRERNSHYSAEGGVEGFP